jgi:hypothetical protein
MKKILINGKEYIDFSEEQHIKQHTKRENTHCNECPYCERVRWIK